MGNACLFRNYILWDTRLLGSMPLLPEALITSKVGATVSLTTAFAKINTASGRFGKLGTLFVLAHGGGGGAEVKTGQQFLGDIRWKGGSGVQLGSEGLSTATVNMWAAIRDSVRRIVVYACGAAYTGPSSLWAPAGMSDGQSLMAALAKHTNAIVYAADRLQWYDSTNLDFDQWEGTVYMFLPRGGRLAGLKPPTNIIDVISGRCPEVF